MEEQGLAQQGVQQGQEAQKEMVMQVVQLLMQGVTPDELIQKGVPKEIIQMAMQMVQQQQQMQAQPQGQPVPEGLAGSQMAQGRMQMDKSPIKIKPENKGKFTKYCKDKGHEGVTGECIEEGLASSSIAVNKRAQFAANAKKWNK